MQRGRALVGLEREGAQRLQRGAEVNALRVDLGEDSKSDFIGRCNEGSM